MARTPKKPQFPNRLRVLRKARGRQWTLEYVAERLNTDPSTISRRESGARDLKASDLESHLRLLGATYEEAYPGSNLDGATTSDLTAEINRLCDELGMDVLDQMPMEQVPRAVRARVLRTATERFRAAAAELLALKRSSKS